MIINYNDCIRKYGSDYKLKKELMIGEIVQLEKGWYSDTRFVSDIALISAKYPRAVFTSDSAFYYHGLTDVIPDLFTLATKRSETRITDKRIHQFFVKDELFDIGISSIEYNGDIIRVYDEERMLIELIRFRSRYAFDYYKEIIGNYRNRIYKLNFNMLEQYASCFSNGAQIMDAIEREVI